MVWPSNCASCNLTEMIAVRRASPHPEGLVVLEQLVFLAVVVQNAGQRGLEAGLVRAALGGIDIVGEGQHQLAVAVGVLHGDLGHRGVAAALHVDDLLVQRGLGAVEMLDELTDAALVVHDLLDRLIVALSSRRVILRRVQGTPARADAFRAHRTRRPWSRRSPGRRGSGWSCRSRSRTVYRAFYGRHAALKAHECWCDRRGPRPRASPDSAFTTDEPKRRADRRRPCSPSRRTCRLRAAQSERPRASECPSADGCRRECLGRYP